MREIIQLSHVTKDYGGGRGVFDVSFSVGEWEVFGYLGPNGAGKTTTIRQLMGFLHSDVGVCQILGKNCFAQAGEIEWELGYLAGELAFLDDMTGIRYLEFIAQMKRVKDLARMRALMERFELNPKGKIGRMSKGMKQKIGLVAAFMADPKVVILDEPTSGLDPLMQNRFVELILEEKKKGTTILMSSHIFEEVEKTCDRTAIIRAGKIVGIEDMDSLAGKRKKVYVITFADEAAAERLAADPGVEARARHGNRVELIVRGNPKEALLKIAAADPLDLDVRTQNLEDLFMHYYGEEAR